MNEQYFVVWDLETGSLLGTPDTQNEAVSIAAAIIESLGEGHAAHLSIGWENEEGEGEDIASGDALLQLVRLQSVAIPS